MSSQRRIEDYDKVLVVEGYSDLLFYAEALQHLGKSSEVFIKHFNGKSDIEAKLEAFLSPGFLASKVRCGIIIDADENAESSANKFSSLLSKFTNQEVSLGQWSAGSPKIGFLVVPGATESGEIETLVWNAWSNAASSAPAKRSIESYLKAMAAVGLKPKSIHKGLLGSYLAIRNDDDPRLGPSARIGAFDFTAPEYKELMQFFSGF